MSLDLAWRSLAGLSVGDAMGNRLFNVPLEEIRQQRTPDGPWSYTDDTEMALSIVAMLREFGDIQQDRLAKAFALRYTPVRGYGAAAHQLLQAIGHNPSGYWRSLTPALFGGQGSLGNGSAMRVAPLGAFFAARPVELLVEQARLSAEVTHSHPDGIAGAVAVALAAGYLSRAQTFHWEDYWEHIVAHTPPGPTREGLLKARAFPQEASGRQAAAELGNGHKVICQDTVPFCLWSAGLSPDDFEATFWRTAEGMGDQDTCCAIACGVVACRARVPSEWLLLREPLPPGFAA